MLFQFPPKKPTIFLDTVGEMFYFSQEPVEYCGDTFLFSPNCSGKVGEIVFGNDDYSVFEGEKFQVLENIYRTFSLDKSERRTRTLFQQKEIRWLFLKYFSLLEQHISSLNVPPNYDLLLFIRELIYDIATREIILSGGSPTNLVGKKILYNMYRGKTGRMVTERESFPILNLKKEDRRYILPTNNFLCEYDLVSADFRVFLQIFGEQEELELAKDIDLYKEKDPEKRAKKKQEIFSLIYSKTYNWFFQKLGIAEKCTSLISGENENFVFVETPIYKRRLAIPKGESGVDFHYIVSYVIQSLTNDSVFDAIKSIYSLLRGKKSFIKCLIHDSFVIDWDEEEYMEIGKEVKERIHKIPFLVFWKERQGKNMLLEE